MPHCLAWMPRYGFCTPQKIVTILSLFCVSPRAKAVEEKALSHQLQNGMLSFFEKGHTGHFYNRDGKSREIQYRTFRHPESKKLIVISPGRGESQWIYSELIFDLYHRGFSVAIMDHHGQGASRDSGDPAPEAQKVDRFDDYVQDFRHFLDLLSRRSEFQDNSVGILAHSVGSVIALRALIEEKEALKVSALVLSSPMLQIRTEPVPQFLAGPLVQLLSFVDRDKVAPFQKTRKDLELERLKRNSSNQGRRELLRRLHFERSGRQALYPSIGWVEEALNAPKKILNFTGDLKLPILVFSSHRDPIVVHERSQALMRLSPAQCEITLIPRRFHDLWLESDSVREPAFQRTAEFFHQELSQKN